MPWLRNKELYRICLRLEFMNGKVFITCIYSNLLDMVIIDIIFTTKHKISYKINQMQNLQPFEKHVCKHFGQNKIVNISSQVQSG